MRPRLALSPADTLDRTQGPLVLASSVALVVLSSAAEVGLGEGLLRGHGGEVALEYGGLAVWRSDGSSGVGRACYAVGVYRRVVPIGLGDRETR